MTSSFEGVLDHLRSIAGTEAEKGRLFERLMKTYLGADLLYRDRFSNVWLWSEWASEHPGLSGSDTGVDLVAEERSGQQFPLKRGDQVSAEVLGSVSGSLS